MKIVVALDGSQFSEKALAKACAMTREENAELHLISVYPDFMEVGEVALSARDVLRDHAQAIAARGKAEAAAAGVDAVAVIRSDSSAANGIVTYAAEIGAGLIIMGHKSKSGMEKLLVGSVASMVVTYAPCSVLVVR